MHPSHECNAVAARLHAANECKAVAALLIDCMQLTSATLCLFLQEQVLTVLQTSRVACGSRFIQLSLPPLRCSLCRLEFAHQFQCFFVFRISVCFTRVVENASPVPRTRKPRTRDLQLLRPTPEANTRTSLLVEDPTCQI
jgi:hypothetical protein